MLAQAILVTMIILGATGALLTISQIGKPITPGLAVFAVVYNAAFVVGLIHIYFRR